MKMKLLAILAFSVLCGFASGQANAAMIQGDIDFNGNVTFNTTSLNTATQVNIWNNAFVSQRTGDFAPFVNVFDLSTMATPWVFNSGTPGTPLPGGSTPALWSVDGFTFDLSSSTVVFQSSTFLNVTGVGTLSGHSYDPTPGFWSFTASSDGSPHSTFSFQANSAVPEMSTIGLFAVGSLGMVGMYCWRGKRCSVRVNPS